MKKDYYVAFNYNNGTWDCTARSESSNTHFKVDYDIGTVTYHGKTWTLVDYGLTKIQANRLKDAMKGAQLLNRREVGYVSDGVE
jgi:hypothetical protein